MRSWSATFSTGGSSYVFSEKIKPGLVLYVLGCFAYAPERDNNDDVIIGVRDGAGDFILAAEAPSGAQYGVQAGVGVYLGEGDQMFASFPDAENGDTLEIHLMGVMMTLAEFQGGQG